MKKNSHTNETTKKEFLARVARMYYILGMNQKEIAQQLGIGRSSVGRFLSEARKEGVVQIQIGYNANMLRNTDSEHTLIDKYNLKDAVVVKRLPGNNFENIVVDYMNSILPFQGRVGLTGGHTLYQVGQHMHTCESRPDLKLVQLSGNAGNLPSTSVIQSWSQALKAEPVYIHAPAFANDKETKEIFMQQMQIKKSFDEIKELDMLVVAIGTSDRQATILQLGTIPDLTSDKLRKNSVGDISYHFFNEQGHFSMHDISDRLVGASIEDLLTVPVRAAIAYGGNKIPAIKAALVGKLVNILLTDEDTAKELL